MSSRNKDRVFNSVEKLLKNRIKLQKEQQYLFIIRAAEIFIELSKLGKLEDHYILLLDKKLLLFRYVQN